MSRVSHLYAQKPHLVPNLMALGEAALGDLLPKRFKEAAGESAQESGAAREAPHPGPGRWKEGAQKSGAS